jgi:hypothetical protein
MFENKFYNCVGIKFKEIEEALNQTLEEEW